jgi:hypothetical protein
VAPGYVTKRLRSALALLTIAALLGLPLQAFAAKGTNLAAEAATLTPQVAASQLLAFRVGLKNSGNSTITQFRFDGSVTAGATFFAAASSSACSASSGGADVSCSLGTLASGEAVELVLVFTAPSSPATVTLDGAFRGDAKNGTPGAKQDTWAIPSQSVVVRQGSTDFFGTYQLNTGAQSYTIGSVQRTVVNVPAQANAYGISIGHSSAEIPCGTRNYFGDTVELNVANGHSPVSLTITFAAQPGLTPQQAKVVHESGGLCDVPPPDCGASPGHCQTATYVGSGPNRRVQVTVQLPSNGSIKGFR